jgi:2-iminoacetate synthase ThiH
MDEIVNQFKAEEEEIKGYLMKSGLNELSSTIFIDTIKSNDPDKKAERNVSIKQLAEILKGRSCALQNWYIYDLLSKVTGLSPSYINRIAYEKDPASILKTRVA